MTDHGNDGVRVRVRVRVRVKMTENGNDGMGVCQEAGCDQENTGGVLSMGSVMTEP